MLAYLLSLVKGKVKVKTKVVVRKAKKKKKKIPKTTIPPHPSAVSKVGYKNFDARKCFIWF